MKAIIALLSALIALVALTVNCESSSEISSSEFANMPEKKWADYKLQHNKQYDDDEDKVRFEIFQNALKTIEEHNAKYEKGETTFKMGLNHMTDWKDEEKGKMFGLRNPDESKTEN